MIYHYTFHSICVTAKAAYQEDQQIFILNGPTYRLSACKYTNSLAIR